MPNIYHVSTPTLLPVLMALPQTAVLTFLKRTWMWKLPPYTALFVWTQIYKVLPYAALLERK